MTLSPKLKKAWNVFTTILVSLVVLFAVLLVGVRVFGVQVYAVISGSMEPDYPVGCLIYVKQADETEVGVDQVVTFALADGTVATHRIVRMDEEKRLIYTQGDANDDEDAPFSYDNLIGKPVFMIPLLGYVAFFIQHPPGSYIAISISLILLILVFLPDLFKTEKKAPKASESGEEEQPE